MKIDIEYLKLILSELESIETPYIPVALLAKKLGGIYEPNNTDEEIEVGYDEYSLSEKFVSHLLHLQDLNAFQNVDGYFDWGYKVVKENDNGKYRIEESMNNDVFAVDHCYESKKYDSVIRITAEGRSLLQIIDSESLVHELKEQIVSGSLSGLKEGAKQLTKLGFNTIINKLTDQ
ncbi:MAG: hypothetical protein ACRBEE_09925 [Arenicella sp.]